MSVNTETRRKRRSLVVAPELEFGNTEVTFTTIFDPLEPGKGSKSLRGGGNEAAGMQRRGRNYSAEKVNLMQQASAATLTTVQIRETKCTARRHCCVFRY